MMLKSLNNAIKLQTGKAELKNKRILNTKIIRKILSISSCIIIFLGLANMAYATEVSGNKVIDVTPPWGRIKIIGATLVDNVNYVDRAELEVQIYATDDMCQESEIKYYINTTPILSTEIIDDNLWENYTEGKIKKITLPSTTSTNKIYAVFKDATGNTSLIYNGEDTKYTIQYDANVQGEEITMPEGVGTTGYYGMPFTVTTQAPRREGYYLLGWSTNKNATAASYRPGSIIPADVFTGTEKTITLYAIWTTEESGLPLLADVVNIGDYVNYPVFYDTVESSVTFNGWRVISKDIDLDGNDSLGTVNLVSAGVPLTFKNWGGVTQVNEALIDNFLVTPFSVSDAFTYMKTGFSPHQTLIEIFSNKYTQINENMPIVRAMSVEDVLKVTGDNEIKEGNTLNVSDKKYNDLFRNNFEYFLPSQLNSNYLWKCAYGTIVRESGYHTYCVRPVVSLKSTVKASGQDMIGAWNIEI